MESMDIDDETSSSLTVEKVLGKKTLIDTSSNITTVMYYIKWKSLSYLHASWESHDDIISVDSNSAILIQNFINMYSSSSASTSSSDNDDSKKRLGIINDDNYQYFDSNYTNVDMVISSSNNTHSHCSSISDLISSISSSSTDDDVSYLVKWVGLPESEATWYRHHHYHHYHLHYHHHHHHHHHHHNHYHHHHHHY